MNANEEVSFRNFTPTNDSMVSLSNNIPLASKILIGFVLIFIDLVTISVNTLVIYAIFNYRRLRNVQNMFLVSLAVADITVGVLVMPFSISNIIKNRWRFGPFVCKMWLTFAVLCCTTSIMNLCAIALDRYWAIRDPIKYAPKRTLKRVLLAIAIVWSASFLISVPPFIGFNAYPNLANENEQCRIRQDNNYVIYTATIFLIPCFVITTVYIKVYQLAKQSFHINNKTIKVELKGTIKPIAAFVKGDIVNEVSTDVTTREELDVKTDALHNISGSDSEVTEDILEPPKEQTHLFSQTPQIMRASETNSSLKRYIREKRKISVSKERHAARVLGMMIGAFLFCWLPFCFMFLIDSLCKPCNVSMELFISIAWLGYFNSAVNPIIYTIFNKDFRAAFADMLSCMLKKQDTGK